MHKLNKSDFRELLNLIKNDGIDKIKLKIDNAHSYNQSNNGCLTKFCNVFGENTKNEVENIYRDYVKFKGGYCVTKTLITQNYPEHSNYPKSGKPFYGNEIDIEIVEFFKSIMGKFGNDKMFLIPVDKVREYVNKLCNLKRRNINSMQEIENITPPNDYNKFVPYRKEYIRLSGGLYKYDAFIYEKNSENEVLELLKLRVDLGNKYGILIPVNKTLRHCCDILNFFKKYPGLDNNL